MDVTSTVTAVNAAFQTAGQTVLDFITGNAATILTVFGVVAGIALLMRLFRRVAGR